jgi:hypothetical protein
MQQDLCTWCLCCWCCYYILDRHHHHHCFSLFICLQIRLFIILKDDAETLPQVLVFSRLPKRIYNFPFIDDLLVTLERCSNASLGPDIIHNQMLTHLPLAGKAFLLSMYNCVWTENSVPAAWREAVVVPVLKPQGPLPCI